MDPYKFPIDTSTCFSCDIGFLFSSLMDIFEQPNDRMRYGSEVSTTHLFICQIIYKTDVAWYLFKTVDSCNHQQCHSSFPSAPLMDHACSQMKRETHLESCFQIPYHLHIVYDFSGQIILTSAETYPKWCFGIPTKMPCCSEWAIFSSLSRCDLTCFRCLFGYVSKDVGGFDSWVTCWWLISFSGLLWDYPMNERICYLEMFFLRNHHQHETHFVWIYPPGHGGK